MEEGEMSEVVELLKQQNELLKKQNDIHKEELNKLNEIYSFWTKIVSDEYFNEMMQAEGYKLPK